MLVRTINSTPSVLPPGLGQLEGATLLISGDDHAAMAGLTHRAIIEGANVVLVPNTFKDVTLPSFGSKKLISLHCPADAPTEISVRDSRNTEGTCRSESLTLYTSGSTGEPKPFTLSRQQLDLTGKWYRDIYALTPGSVIVSSLPLTYNFPIIAGVWAAEIAGCSYHHLSSSRLPLSIDAARSYADKVVVLANPVIIESLLNDSSIEFLSGVLADTGGAPLSTTALRMFRNRVGDIREGYGLTETCSLTHFDVEGSESSRGTVGRPLPGVECEVRHTPAGLPELWIASPNLGQGVFRPENIDGRFYRTGDLARVDVEGRWRILGRSSDSKIGMYYPRDTLDLIGPLLGPRCALVQHTGPSDVVIKLRRLDEPDLSQRVATRVSEALQIPISNVRVLDQATALTYSLKLTREP
jgi:acyl-CoA synthetase (AMP-forming)/AMP-acid ligase II